MVPRSTMTVFCTNRLLGWLQVRPICWLLNEDEHGRRTTWMSSESFPATGGKSLCPSFACPQCAIVIVRCLVSLSLLHTHCRVALLTVSLVMNPCLSPFFFLFLLLPLPLSVLPSSHTRVAAVYPNSLSLCLRVLSCFHSLGTAYDTMASLMRFMPRSPPCTPSLLFSLSLSRLLYVQTSSDPTVDTNKKAKANNNSDDDLIALCRAI